MTTPTRWKRCGPRCGDATLVVRTAAPATRAGRFRRQVVGKLPRDAVEHLPRRGLIVSLRRRRAPAVLFAEPAARVASFAVRLVDASVAWR